MTKLNTLKYPPQHRLVIRSNNFSSANLDALNSILTLIRHSHLGEEVVQRVLRGTSVARICNVWRPLVGPVNDCPFVMADCSLDEKRDFEETLHAPPGCRTGENQMLRYHPEQKWYYLSKMETDECLLLKCFDSGTGVRAPHSVSL